jgi:hypothetical protein
MLEVERDVESGIRRGDICCVTCVGRVYFTGCQGYISVGCHRTEYRPFVRADTYMHLGRTAAIILAPSTPRLFDARLRFVKAPIFYG